MKVVVASRVLAASTVQVAPVSTITVPKLVNVVPSAFSVPAPVPAASSSVVWTPPPTTLPPNVAPGPRISRSVPLPKATSVAPPPLTAPKLASVPLTVSSPVRSRALPAATETRPLTVVAPISSANVAPPVASNVPVLLNAPDVLIVRVDVPPSGVASITPPLIKATLPLPMMPVPSIVLFVLVRVSAVTHEVRIVAIGGDGIQQHGSAAGQRDLTTDREESGLAITANLLESYPGCRSCPEASWWCYSSR